MNTMTQEEALKWIADLLNESVDTIKPETPREAVSEWDSLGVLTLMAEMDEKFGIVLSDDDTQAMTKVDDILGVIRKNGKLSG